MVARSQAWCLLRKLALERGLFSHTHARPSPSPLPVAASPPGVPQPPGAFVPLAGEVERWRGRLPGAGAALGGAAGMLRIEPGESEGFFVALLQRAPQ